MTAEQVIAELKALDCRIIGGAVPKIYPPERVELRKRFEGIKEWLSKYRSEILAHFEPPAPRQLCPLCSRDVTDAEDRQRLADINPWCCQGEAPAVWRLGRQVEKKISGCPYRQTNSGEC